VIFISSDRFTEHQTPPGHPERPERAKVMHTVAERWQAAGNELVAPREATREQLLRVHDPGYVQRMADAAGQSLALDPDTYTSPESHEVALLAAGAAVDAVERVMSATHTAASALVRPPGHHAERARAMGFCLFNNVAIAVAHARANGARRVAVMDFDVHHGNGTQHLFERDPSVLYLSTHQYPYYPGTGAADETGVDEGAGFTVNLPLESGAVDADYRIVFDEIVVPVILQFEPDLLVVSAGYDAHERDPLATMRLTSGAFGAMTMALRQVAEEVCRGRLVLVTEGGYDLQALAASLEETVTALVSPLVEPSWPAPTVTSSRGRTAADRVKRAIAPFWKVK
jgi:acetoin utilization deacetylase AcuC-like enzyme